MYDNCTLNLVNKKTTNMFILPNCLPTQHEKKRKQHYTSLRVCLVILTVVDTFFEFFHFAVVCRLSEYPTSLRSLVMQPRQHFLERREEGWWEGGREKGEGNEGTD